MCPSACWWLVRRCVGVLGKGAGCCSVLSLACDISSNVTEPAGPRRARVGMSVLCVYLLRLSLEKKFFSNLGGPLLSAPPRDVIHLCRIFVSAVQ